MIGRDSERERASRLESGVALGQGLYFLVTAIWPLVHIASFMKVTGPKRDIWLVKTVATVIGAVGLALTLGGLRRSRQP